MKTTFIVGAGGQAKVVIDLLKRTNKYSNLKVFDESYQADLHDEILGATLYGKIDDLKNLFRGEDVYFAIGDIAKRAKMIDYLNIPNCNLKNLIHPTANISETAKLGIGNYIGPLVNIGPSATVGNHNLINTHVNIEHDADVGSYNNLSPGCILLGGTKVFNKIFIGSGAVIKEQITVYDNIVIGSNSFVNRNLTVSNKKYAGIPICELK